MQNLNMNASKESAIDWLKKQNPDFGNLTLTELNTVMHFTLVWSYFEATKLATCASSKSIQAWAKKADFNFSKFESSFNYFRNRYFENTESDLNFKGLNFKNNIDKDFVKKNIQNNKQNSTDNVAALLIVVYRLRNNLFHGTKWGNGINGQKENFLYATQALIAACETNEQ